MRAVRAIRLGFRDVWSFCYLEQLHLDSSFFRLEDPFRGRKSQDACGSLYRLHSERLSQLEVDYMKTLDDQAGKREAVVQIRTFMQRFDLGLELDVVAQVEQAQQELTIVETRRAELERQPDGFNPSVGSVAPAYDLALARYDGGAVDFVHPRVNIDCASTTPFGCARRFCKLPGQLSRRGNCRSPSALATARHASIKPRRCSDATSPAQPMSWLIERC